MLALAFAVAFAVAFGAAGARAAEPFYAGKTITFYVSSSAGGGSDLNCRIVAQYMGRHIAGEPSIIVKNMVSADNILATNYVATEARNDGLSVRCGAFAPGNQLLGVPGLKVDLTQFNYIAGSGSPLVFYARRDVLPGAGLPEDFFAAKGLVLGGTSLADKDIFVRGLLAALGIENYKYVTGFAGDAAVRAAFQQKFINMTIDSMSTYAQITVPSLVNTGEAVPLYQTGLVDAKGDLALRDARFPDLPSFAEFYRAKYGKPPSGPAWELSQRILSANNVGIYAIGLPPGAPPDAVAAMRASVEPLNRDPDFIPALEKISGKGAREADGATVAASLSQFIQMPPELVEFYKGIIRSGQETQQKAQ